MSVTSQTTQFVLKNSEGISNIAWYEIAKDFSSPVIAILVVFCSVWFAFKQLNKQHQNTLDAQKEAVKRKTKIELFKELNATIIQYELPISETATSCWVKKYTNPDSKAEVTYDEFTQFMNTFASPLTSLILKVEANEIINEKLFKAFRYALSSIHHDFFAMQFSKDRFAVLEQMIQLTDDAKMYIADFQICLQNMAYSDVFDKALSARVPIDQRIKVITNDEQELENLIYHFTTQTAWGKMVIKTNAESEVRFEKSNKNIMNKASKNN